MSGSDKRRRARREAEDIDTVERALAWAHNRVYSHHGDELVADAKAAFGRIKQRAVTRKAISQ